MNVLLRKIQRPIDKGSQNPIKCDAENNYNRDTIANRNNGINEEQTVNGESN